MHTWKTHLEALLRRLAETHGDAPLREIQRTLASVLEAHSVRFQTPQGSDLPPNTALSSIRDQPIVVSIDIHSQVLGTTLSQAAVAPSDDHAQLTPESRFQPGEAATDSSTTPFHEAFIREFARLEQRHEFMWAGYVVRELLPRMGFPLNETKLILDRLCSEGILAISKVPNPKNPNFPATGVQLNREHPRVRAALEAQPAEPPPNESPSEPTELASS
uniref:Uncharacterized protein n=1 Tax=uncultured Planctomycetota bacterium TaxID=120965 RepID=A0A5B8KFD5_9BACT|nr:hypothetical protein fos2004AM_00005 [uncultured Planctomycetota bacterium]